MIKKRRKVRIIAALEKGISCDNESFNSKWKHMIGKTFTEYEVTEYLGEVGIRINQIDRDGYEWTPFFGLNEFVYDDLIEKLDKILET